MAWWNDLAARLKGLFSSVPGGFDWETAGPEPDEHPPVPVGEFLAARNSGNPDLGPTWLHGLWMKFAQQRPANSGRLGGQIIPRCVVVHTTDTLGGFQGIVDAWTGTVGKRNCAHFLIGRSASEGVVQFAPITRNANHAGGEPHGSFQGRDPSGVPTGYIHPNTVSVGIELLAGGLLKKTAGGWLHADSGKYVPADDVYVDSKGRGWQKVTDYQLMMLDALLADLRPQLQPLPKANAVPDGDYAANGVAYYAQFPGSNVVGHVTLDPINKTDPGPQVMEHLKAA